MSLKSIVLLTAVFLLSVLGGSNRSWAAVNGDETHALMTPEEQEIHLRAKKRMYPGGRDEEPLQVQMQLQQANRKMAPATEAPVEDGPADPTAD